MNFKSHLYSALLCKCGNILPDLHLFCLILFHFTCLCPIGNYKMKDANYKSHWNIFLFCEEWKIMSYLNMYHGRMPDFVSFPLFGFTFVIKLSNFNIESHWKTLIFFLSKRYGIRFEYVLWKYVWLCFISLLFGFALVIKLWILGFESH